MDQKIKIGVTTHGKSLEFLAFEKYQLLGRLLSV